MRQTVFFTTLLLAIGFSCQQPAKQDSETKTEAPQPFLWENANVYFLLTDRFLNADSTNDYSFGREQNGAQLRSFMGGDLKGVIAKIDDGYFDDLGVTALWFNPAVEQIHGSVDEGTGKTYAYHGYWARDWTNLDPNFGTMQDLRVLVKKAHAHGIRVLLDVVINHTGPVTSEDSQWPDSWVRTSPQCDYKTKEGTISCTLVANLPDVLTGSDAEVELPEFLVEKWKAEGRYDEEVAELDTFFKETGYPRAPRFYIMKWLADYVRELGIDGFRVDTAKHTEASIWAELYKIASAAFQDWKASHPDEVLDDNEFFMVGEVYNYAVGHGKDFPYDDGQTVNFFDNGFKSLINFSAKSDAGKNPEEVFSRYSNLLNSELKGSTVLNYISSHDDGGPFDQDRKEPYLSGTMLMLMPGQSQIYYGDETARPLQVDGAVGDANLRTYMNWADIDSDETKAILNHWQKLGQFRKDHPAVGAGIHQMVQKSPYIFSRVLTSADFHDEVFVAMDHDGSPIPVGSIFKDGTELTNYYTGETAIVKDRKVTFENSKDQLVLVGLK